MRKLYFPPIALTRFSDLHHHQIRRASRHALAHAMKDLHVGRGGAEPAFVGAL